MGYTWTDGELITATKLNNTGGGGFDAIIKCVSGTPSLDSGDFSAIADKLGNGEFVNFAYYESSTNHCAVGRVTSIDYTGFSIEFDVVGVDYSGLIVWEEDGTIYFD